MTGALFLRNDDVSDMDENLRKLQEYCLDIGLQMHHAVIPARATQRLWNYMLRPQMAGHVALMQHGLSHENHGSEIDKYEFGLKRSCKQQYNDIVKGKDILQKNARFQFSPVFVPPYHAMNNATIASLLKAGIESISLHPCEARGIFNFEVDMNLDDFIFKGRIRTAKEAIIKQGLKGEQRNKPMGIYFHYKLYSGKEFQILKEILGFVRNIRKRFRICRLDESFVSNYLASLKEIRNHTRN